MTSFFDALPFWTLAALVFTLRVSDVTLGTMRMIAVVHGRTAVAVSLGFFEILIWVSAVSPVIIKLGEFPLLMVAYAGGFATGNAVGITLERRLAMGACVVTMISREAGEAVATALRSIGQRVTMLEGTGRDGKRQVIYATAPRRQLKRLVATAKQVDPDIFYVVQLCSEASHITAMAYTGGRGRGWVKHK